MTQAQQPEALQIADECEASAYAHLNEVRTRKLAVAELRRLHSENDQLRAAAQHASDVADAYMERIAQIEAEAKHWRSNHDNVAARLRVFTQRPDLPKELADRLPWYREMVRLQDQLAAQAQQRKPLPNAQIDAIGDRCGKPSFTWHYDFARAIERAHGITAGGSNAD